MVERKLRVVKAGRAATRKRAKKPLPPQGRTRIVIVPMPDGALYAFDQQSMLQVRLLSAVELLIDDADYEFANYREPA